MAQELFSNLSSTTLNMAGGTGTSSAGSVQTLVFNAPANPFPTIGAGQVFKVTLEPGTSSEIVTVTSVSGTNYTVIRGSELTTGTAVPNHVQGVTINHYLVASALNSFTQSVGVTAPLATTGGTIPTLSIGAATGSLSGSLSAVDYVTLHQFLTTSGQTYTFPTLSGVLAALNAANNWTATQTFQGSGASSVPIISKGNASQTADLLTLQVGSTTLSGVRADGLVYASGAGTAATLGGIATLTKAGTPIDTDWATAPPSGTLVVDTTKRKLWGRTGAATWTNLSDKFFNVMDYGAVGDGTTDDSNALINAIAAAYTAGGGTVYVPPATYLILSQLLIPNTASGNVAVGSPVGTQPYIRITGLWGADGGSGGSILVLNYNGGVGKIVTKGYGNLEIDHLGLKSTLVGDTTPFLFQSNTRVNIHHNTFRGVTGCDAVLGGIQNNIWPTQDGIIHGGSGTTTDNSTSSGFAGYPSLYQNNIFYSLRRVFWCQNFSTTSLFSSNYISSACGSNIALGTSGCAPIESYSSVGSSTNNNLWINNNQIEAVNYQTTVHFRSGTYASTILDNQMPDNTLKTTIASPSAINATTISLVGFMPLKTDAPYLNTYQYGVGNGNSMELTRFTASTPTATTTLNGAVSAGANSIVVTSAASISAGTNLVIGSADTYGGVRGSLDIREPAVVAASYVSGTTIPLVSALTYGHSTAKSVTVGPYTMTTEAALVYSHVATDYVSPVPVAVRFDSGAYGNTARILGTNANKSIQDLDGTNNVTFSAPLAGSNVLAQNRANFQPQDTSQPILDAFDFYGNRTFQITGSDSPGSALANRYVYLPAQPATAANTLTASPYLTLQSAYWNGSTSVWNSWFMRAGQTATNGYGSTFTLSSPGYYSGITIDGNYNTSFNAMPVPSALTAAVGATGVVTAGNHVWAVTFLTANGETTFGTLSNTVNASGSTAINLTGIPTGPPAVTARRIYRSLAGVTNPAYSALYLVATINDNTTTILTDNSTDATITANGSSPYSNTAVGKINIGGATIANGGGSTLTLTPASGGSVELNSSVYIANGGALTTAGQMTAGTQGGDLVVGRSSTVGRIWLDTGNTRYLHNDGVTLTASGTALTVNAPTSYAGTLFDLQVAGVSQFSVSTGTNQIVTGMTLQTTNFLQCAGISYPGAGGLTHIGLDSGGHTINVLGGVAGFTPLIVTGASSQTGDLQQWKNVTPTTLSGVRSDGLIYATGTGTTTTNAGIATVTKAGTPADTDWTVAPPNGTIVVDTTGLKLWGRTGAATWTNLSGTTSGTTNRTVTTGTTVLSTDTNVLVNAATTTVTLPTPTSALDAHTVTIKNIASGSSTTVSGLIDGGTSVTLANPYNSQQFLCDNTSGRWYTV